MMFDNVLFLAALSPRSKSYAQAMKASGIHVEKVILFSLSIDSADLEDVSTGFSEEGCLGNASAIPLPNLRIPLKQSCKSLADEIIELKADHINDPLILDTLRECKPDLVIYSGYGGQIVSQDLLRVAPFLHIHAGWLPQYRGSTTIYYSIIKDRSCGVSAILLEPEIDTGAVVISRQFTRPTADIFVVH